MRMTACYSEILGVWEDFFFLERHIRKLPEATEQDIFFSATILWPLTSLPE